jgi:hypothetical protein
MKFVFIPHISRLSGTDLLLKNGNIKNVIKTNLIFGFLGPHMFFSSKAMRLDG